MQFYKNLMWFVFGASFAILVFSWFNHEKHEPHYQADPPDSDPTKTCKIVKHSDGEGYKYWSCEKNQ